jgi:hypothetical protein
VPMLAAFLAATRGEPTVTISAGPIPRLRWRSLTLKDGSVASPSDAESATSHVAMGSIASATSALGGVGVDDMLALTEQSHTRLAHRFDSREGELGVAGQSSASSAAGALILGQDTAGAQNPHASRGVQMEAGHRSAAGADRDGSWAGIAEPAHSWSLYRQEQHFRAATSGAPTGGLSVEAGPVDAAETAWPPFAAATLHGSPSSSYALAPDAATFVAGTSPAARAGASPKLAGALSVLSPYSAGYLAGQQHAALATASPLQMPYSQTAAISRRPGLPIGTGADYFESGDFAPSVTSAPALSASSEPYHAKRPQLPDFSNSHSVGPASSAHLHDFYAFPNGSLQRQPDAAASFSLVPRDSDASEAARAAPAESAALRDSRRVDAEYADSEGVGERASSAAAYSMAHSDAQSPYVNGFAGRSVAPSVASMDTMEGVELTRIPHQLLAQVSPQLAAFTPALPSAAFRTDRPLRSTSASHKNAQMLSPPLVRGITSPPGQIHPVLAADATTDSVLLARAPGRPHSTGPTGSGPHSAQDSSFDFSPPSGFSAVPTDHLHSTSFESGFEAAFDGTARVQRPQTPSPELSPAASSIPQALGPGHEHPRRVFFPSPEPAMASASQLQPPELSAEYYVRSGGVGASGVVPSALVPASLLSPAMVGQQLNRGFVFGSEPQDAPALAAPRRDVAATASSRAIAAPMSDPAVAQATVVHHPGASDRTVSGWRSFAEGVPPAAAPPLPAPWPTHGYVLSVASERGSVDADAQRHAIDLDAGQPPVRVGASAGAAGARTAPPLPLLAGSASAVVEPVGGRLLGNGVDLGLGLPSQHVAHIAPGPSVAPAVTAEVTTEPRRPVSAPSLAPLSSADAAAAASHGPPIAVRERVKSGASAGGPDPFDALISANVRALEATSRLHSVASSASIRAAALSGGVATSLGLPPRPAALSTDSAGLSRAGSFMSLPPLGGEGSTSHAGSPVPGSAFPVTSTGNVAAVGAGTSSGRQSSVSSLSESRSAVQGRGVAEDPFAEVFAAALSATAVTAGVHQGVATPAPGPLEGEMMSAVGGSSAGWITAPLPLAPQSHQLLAPPAALTRLGPAMLPHPAEITPAHLDSQLRMEGTSMHVPLQPELMPMMSLQPSCQFRSATAASQVASGAGVALQAVSRNASQASLSHAVTLSDFDPFGTCPAPQPSRGAQLRCT